MTILLGNFVIVKNEEIMTCIHMINNEVIFVEESLDVIGTLMNYTQLWITLARRRDQNKIIININHILYLDDGKK